MAAGYPGHPPGAVAVENRAERVRPPPIPQPGEEKRVRVPRMVTRVGPRHPTGVRPTGPDLPFPAGPRWSDSGGPEDDDGEERHQDQTERGGHRDDALVWLR